MAMVQYYTDESGIEIIRGARGGWSQVWVKLEITGEWSHPVYADDSNITDTNSQSNMVRFRKEDVTIGELPSNRIVQYYTCSDGIEMIEEGNDNHVWVQTVSNGTWRNPVYADNSNIVDVSNRIEFGRVSFNTRDVTIGEVPTQTVQSNNRLQLWTNEGGFILYEDGEGFSCRDNRHGDWIIPLTIDSEDVSVNRQHYDMTMYQVRSIDSIIFNDRSGVNPRTMSSVQTPQQPTLSEYSQLLDDTLKSITEHGIK
jgi:ribosomal protein L31